MEDVFVPDLKKTYRWLSLCFALAGAGVVLAILAYRRKDFPVRQAAQVLGPLFAVFGLLSAIMVCWDLLRTPAVAVGPTYAIVGNDTLRVSDIQKAYISPISTTSAVGEPEVTDLGILELKDGSNVFFEEEHYDVKAVIGALRTLVER